MHRGTLAELVERGLDSGHLQRIQAGPAALGMSHVVIQKLKAAGVILRAHRYDGDHYAWSPGPKYSLVLGQLKAMEERALE